MAIAPLNVFSQRNDLAAVVGALRSVATEVELDGPENAWTKLVALGPAQPSGGRLRLTIRHDPAYFSEPKGSRQRAGMANYFSGFPDSPHKAAVLRAVEHFQAIFSFPDNDLDVESEDPRLNWLSTMCEAIDGVVFLPGALLDAHGRVLLGASGSADPDATPPRVGALAEAAEEMESHHDDETHDYPLADEAAPNDASTNERVAADDEQGDDDPPRKKTPPEPRRVAKRTLVLACVANRGLIESDLENFDGPAETFSAMIEWLKDVGAFSEAEPEERQVLQRLPGKLERQRMVNSIWRIEGMGVLMWALGLAELPPYDTLVTPNELFAELKFFDRGALRLIGQAKLRSPAQLEAFRIHALMMHWRLRDFALHPQAMNFTEFSKRSWIGEFDLAGFEIVNDDVALQGVPIAEADAELVDVCRSIARERHLAINWLLGESEIYSETDTST